MRSYMLVTQLNVLLQTNFSKLFNSQKLQKVFQKKYWYLTKCDIPAPKLFALPELATTTTLINKLTSIPNAAQYAQRSLVSLMKSIGLCACTTMVVSYISDYGTSAYTGNPQ